MRKLAKLVFAVLSLGLVLGVVSIASLIHHGFSARDQPTRMEAFVARRLRRLAAPRDARQTENPAPQTPEALARARAHFADHCASCHGNDGRGRTQLGQNLYPKAPDMTLADTQGLSDGEIFYIIENGVRLTGMPAWGKSGAHDATESWELVRFIRHLPKITAEELAEMESLNPKNRKELDDEEAIRRFLAGEGDQPTVGQEGHKH